MSKKIIISSIIIVLIIALVLVFVFVLGTEKKPVYSKNPEDWVNDKPGGVKEIDIPEITEDKSFYNENNQRYQKGYVDTVFAYDGMHEGLVFKNEYVGLDEEGNIAVTMQITKDLKPDDGIIQGIIVMEISENNEVPTAYVFLDEDFHRKVKGEINIVWGKTYQKQKRFDFSKQISKGVYMNKIVDDIERFTDDYNGPSYGGVIVGNINKKEAQEGVLDGKTGIMLH